MIYLLIFITIYILSVWRIWWYMRMAHYHPKGKWNGSDPDPDDYWATFCPLVNTVFCTSTFMTSWQDNPNNTNIFKPKKPLT